MMLAIAGGSGSGKTTVAIRLSERLKEHCALLSMDSYYVDLPPGINPGDFNFDAPSAFDFTLLKKDLMELKASRPIRIPSYSFITYRREPGLFTEMKPSSIVIVEGILVLYDPELRKLFDFSIYVETQDDERLLRRIERDMVERQRSIESIIRQYRRFVAPAYRSFVEPQKHYADIILPSGGYNEPGMEIIYNALVQKMRQSRE
ncbi:MAG TPA: uridine kinase [Thermotogota bacterium]|jgi:uridine kinase|nr:MAG: Uridine kinase [Thermotogota bacterium ADurb.Bin062]HNW45854.1 uridine kinase [Thermotogota bacterium]HNY81505.1 uridine kinase [Thermotogota bacterium]HOD90348.1 uridine kinase [Thermotogota bacterium]HOF22507.1 uridine kinase [Thermotogota bacterium]